MLKTRIIESLKRKEIQYLLIIFVVSRLVLTLIGIISEQELTGAPKRTYLPYKSAVAAFDVWGTWDSSWYMQIAEQGYSPLISASGITRGQANYAFFPLYPLLMRGLGFIFFGNNFFAGLFISNVALLFSFYFLFQLTKQDFGEEVAWKAVKYVIIFPTSFILSGLFTESLFLALTLALFYYAKAGRWRMAGILGGFSALTRLLGVFAIFPLVLEWWRQRKKISEHVLLGGVTWLLCIPAGLAVFSFFNYRLTGDWLAFVHIQKMWGRSLLFPSSLVRDWRHLLSATLTTDQVCSLIFVVLLFVFLLLIYKKIRMPLTYKIFTAYSILIPLSTGLFSMPRMMLTVFPLYMALGWTAVRHRTLDEALTIGFLLIQGFLMVFWSTDFNIII